MDFTGGANVTVPRLLVLHTQKHSYIYQINQCSDFVSLVEACSPEVVIFTNFVV